MARPNDLQYSAVFSLSKEVAQKIRENILKTLQENIGLVKDAAEEEAHVYTFDFYKLS